jgi:hypothetical protein
MPALDWKNFDALPGSKNINFENLCRGLMRSHFGQFGCFKALANQPGVEFHIQLSKECSLGTPSNWVGWQCKLFERRQNGTLKSASRNDIEESLRKTEKILPDLTDWILWTPYTLSKDDQDWYYNLSTKYKLHLWAEEEIYNYLSGDGLALRSSYFGELILTPSNLKDRHNIAIQPIRERWMEPVHQAVDAERIIRRMLGESDSWEELVEVGECLKKASDLISLTINNSTPRLQPYMSSFIEACLAFSDTLTNFHTILAAGDLDVIHQKLGEYQTLITQEVRAVPRYLRSANHPTAMYATNALDDMFTAQALLDEAKEYLDVGLVAVLADAGGGKTQMAAQITASQENRLAGVFFQGRNLHKGQSLNNLAQGFSINGVPVPSMESLLIALDSAGKRACCRLPIIIDGLNEAENPQDWKSELASLNEIIKKFPNVLVICTLRTGERRREEQSWKQSPQTESRESFAVMALPSGITTVESEGFGGDVEAAIDKYFEYFNINSGDAEIPLEFLQHPLTLRIFCEVTNPQRKTIVKVDYFPTSLAPLFEKYIANAANRISEMTNLTHTYTTHAVDKAIYTLGMKLWESGKREIDENPFRQAIDDTSRPWDSSIINLLTQEGILFRNIGAEPYEFVVTPIYDALGGYLIANALLTKYKQDYSFNWINTPESIAAFSGNDSHALGFDTFRSLVTLAPRRMGRRQLWKHVGDPLKKNAIALAAEIDANYLDQDTVIILLNLLQESSRSSERLFKRFQAARAVEDHPLNINFLDKTLRDMSVAERDLIWTEWIRATRSGRFSDLLALENRWKQHITERTPSDRLRAKWVMWLLTSTDRELRDIATRALYWFGRGNPTALFEETLSSLSINDPYVPERMLAASYGVAMAKHVDLTDPAFVTDTLPTYARSLYSSMFQEDALFSTTHHLMREYGSRTLEMAALHSSDRFTPQEVQRTKPPFSDGGLREWGESDVENRSDSPFMMDFENYTLGRLIPGRSNYDFQNEGYQKIRSQILWRIGQLGWSSERFKHIEQSIAEEYRWSRSERNGKKTDRYGKKYSWIAFFEMSGLLQDLNKINRPIDRDWNWDLDIDPSFPAQLPDYPLVNADFLGDPEMERQEWITNGAHPDVNPYLRLSDIQNEAGPWIILDGYITQENKTLGRSIFCFVRSFLVLSNEADSFLKRLSNQDLGGRWLPEKPSVHYTFSGEVPWCETFPENPISDFSFIEKEENVKVEKMQKVFFLDSRQLDLNESDMLRLSLGISDGSSVQIDPEDIERIEVREIAVMVDEVERYSVIYHSMIPVCDLSWENDLSAANSTGDATTLSKEIACSLGLISQPQSVDLFTDEGVRATYNVVSGDDDFKNSQRLFYIREKLLGELLKENELSLIWAVWGEREYSSEFINGLSRGDEYPNPAYKAYSYVKRYE